jgi:hypothetical protein
MCCPWETLLKGKAQYSWPPCTNLFRSAPLYIENIIYIYQTSNPNEEVKLTETSPLAVLLISSLILMV